MKDVLFNTHDLALIITIYQCLLFALFTMTLKRGKRSSNILLGLFLLSQAAIPLDNLINFGELFKYKALAFSPNVFYVFGFAYWLEAPLLLFYTRSLIYKDYHFSKQELLYFVPFVIYIIYFYFHWWALDDALKISYLKGNIVAEASILDRGFHVFREVFRFACGLLCLAELRHYREQIKNEVSYIESVNLNWLQILTMGFLLIRIIAVIVALEIISVYEFNFSVDHEAFGLLSNYAAMLFISGLIFFSAGHSNIFRGIDTRLSPKNSKDKEAISPDVIEKIEHYMRTKKPYLNQLLTQENLANQLALNPRALSSIINQHYKKNFFEFINSYRIDESKSLLMKEEHIKTTMLDIMDMAGFNSKATFNTFFKKLVGETPTQYRKNYWLNRAAELSDK